MKKKLLIVGNKIPSYNIENIINNFDFVVRLNRLNNYELTGIRTDLLLVDPHNGYYKLLLQENDISRFKYAKQLLIHIQENTDLNRLNLIFNDEQINSAKYCKLDYYKNIKNSLNLVNEIESDYPTNSFRLIQYCIDNFSKEYDIYVTCIDIYNRNYNLHENPIWTNIHKSTILYEETVLIDQINSKIINYIDTDKIINIPSFSSFWHDEETNILPNIVVASIKSFLNAGYKYYLYVYKEFTNIPNGVIIKNANDIVPYSNFYINNGSYAPFSDWFRLNLLLKEDTAWTDTDNFFIKNNFKNIILNIIQDGFIQNGVIYLGNSTYSQKIKKLIKKFVDNPFIIHYFFNNEQCKNCKKLNINIIKNNLTTLKEKLQIMPFNYMGSRLWTNIYNKLNLISLAYDYYKYFNPYKYDIQYKLYNDNIETIDKNVFDNICILTLSTDLLRREPQILKNYNKNSFIENILKSI